LANAAASNYNAYNYDMTTPQFTPDGRLLQVEYASLAATHSSPCILWRLPGEELTLVMVAKSSKKLQQRLIPLSSSSNQPSTAVCLSGILGDSLALVAKVYEMQDEMRRTYGIATLSPMQVATAIASACQRHSFGGGLRPYGSTICVLSSSNQQVLQTDPSGAITTNIFDVDNNVHVVGSKSALALRRKLQDEETPETTLAEALQLAAKHLLSSSSNNDDKEKTVWLEVMIVSKSKGIYKLSEEQVERLVESAKKAASSSS
jgi:20S proteasome alpha/beta subunit